MTETEIEANKAARAEAKRGRFEVLSEKRIGAITRQIATFSNLSAASYGWEVAEVEAAFRQINNAVRLAKARFETSKRWQTAVALKAKAASKAA